MKFRATLRRLNRRIPEPPPAEIRVHWIDKSRPGKDAAQPLSASTQVDNSPPNSTDPAEAVRMEPGMEVIMEGSCPI